MITKEKLVILEEYEKELVEFVDTKNKIRRDYLRNLIVSKFKPLLGFTSKDIEHHAILISQPQESDDIKTSFSLKEIMELQNTVPDWIVPNLVRAGGGLWMLSGSPKAGKTLVGGYDLAFSVAVMGDFLGSPCTTGRVLFFECEESNSTVARRFRDRGVDEFNVENKEALTYAIENDLIRVEKDFSLLNIPKLKKLLRNYKPHLVIFDSLRAISSDLDTSENSSDFSRFIYTLQKTLIMEGVSGVLIHHNKKNAKAQGIEGVSGSLSIAGATDGVILLYKSENDDDNSKNEHKVEIQTIPRDGLPIHWVLRDSRDPDTGYKKFVKVKEYGVEPQVIKLERRILRVLSKIANQEFNLISYEDICREISEDPKNGYIREAIERLAESSQIKHTRMRSENTGLVVNYYSIPISSPWIKLGDTATGQYPEFAAADELLSCSSKEEIETLLDNWVREKGDKFKRKIWTVLNDRERSKIHRILTPPVFPENTWVRVMADGSAEKIKECKYDLELSQWIYFAEGKPNLPFSEQELKLDLDYATDTINTIDEGVF